MINEIQKGFVILNCAKLTTAVTAEAWNEKTSPFLNIRHSFNWVLLCYIVLFFYFSYVNHSSHLMNRTLVPTCPFFTPFFDMIVFWMLIFLCKCCLVWTCFCILYFPNVSIPLRWSHIRTHGQLLRSQYLKREDRSEFTARSRGHRGSKLSQVMLSIYCHLANHCLTSVLWRSRSYVSHVACLCSDAWNTCFLEKK